jgi:hypothetical protein
MPTARSAHEDGKKVLMLVVEGYEDLEFWYPVLRLYEEKAGIIIVGREKKKYPSNMVMKLKYKSILG